VTAIHALKLSGESTRHGHSDKIRGLEADCATVTGLDLGGYRHSD
jgi:hypothetical protein